MTAFLKDVCWALGHELLPENDEGTRAKRGRTRHSGGAAHRCIAGRSSRCLPHTGDRTEYPCLVPQHGQVRDGLTADRKGEVSCGGPVAGDDVHRPVVLAVR